MFVTELNWMFLGFIAISGFLQVVLDDSILRNLKKVMTHFLGKVPVVSYTGRSR